VDPVSICNLALGWLGAQLINTLDDESTEARLCKANFDLVRDAVLEAKAWTFATKRYVLAPDAGAPEFGWSKRFPLPPEVVRVLRCDAPRGDGRLPWAREGAFILADDTDVLHLAAIVRVEDAAQWSPAFGNAVAARLAAELAVPLSENRSLQADLWSLYERKLKQAGTLDGMQGRAEQFGPGRLARSRL
jgi:hypothetical protein